MFKVITCTFVFVLSTAVPSFAQSINTQKLVAEWFTRLNALDDWFISMDGKERTEEVVDSLIELYAPDAVQFVGPTEDQIGPVMLVGRERIRKWFDDFARTYVLLAYRTDVQTAGKEQTTSLIYTTPMPWGGLAASCQITAVYSLRQDRRKFMAPGLSSFSFAKTGRSSGCAFWFRRTRPSRSLADADGRQGG